MLAGTTPEEPDAAAHIDGEPAGTCVLTDPSSGATKEPEATTLCFEKVFGPP
jgi:hypothetical protein